MNKQILDDAFKEWAAGQGSKPQILGASHEQTLNNMFESLQNHMSNVDFSPKKPDKSDFSISSSTIWRFKRTISLAKLSPQDAIELIKKAENRFSQSITPVETDSTFVWGKYISKQDHKKLLKDGQDTKIDVDSDDEKVYYSIFDNCENDKIEKVHLK